jgi:hypothetical protein
MGIRTAVFIVLALCTETVSAGPFSPGILRLISPSQIHCDFDGREIRIPVTVSGAQADVVFAVFTQNMSPYINRTRNGYLGWHYVNRVDTCVYISAPYHFEEGNNTISWNGRDSDGNLVKYSPDNYHYYLWGYDRSSQGLKANAFIGSKEFASATILTKNYQGTCFSQPMIVTGLPSWSSPAAESRQVVRSFWIVGDDPNEISLLRPLKYMSSGEAPRLGTAAETDGIVFYSLSAEQGAIKLYKREWAPNGDALPAADWGEHGAVSFPFRNKPDAPLYGLPEYGGPVSDGAGRLYFPYFQPYGSEYNVPDSRAVIACVDAADGALVRSLDLTPWWSSPPDEIHCPDSMEYKNGMLFLSSPSSCLVQMIDPYFEDLTGFVRWENGYGDGTWDNSLPPVSWQKTWTCFGSDTPPNPADISVDSNMFSVFPATGLGGASFGAFAPDGTGLGYFPIPGVEDGTITSLKIINYGSAYDGMYYTYSGANGDSTGVWHRGFSTCGGIIGQWYDTPYYKHLDLVYPLYGAQLIARLEYPITWEVEGIEYIRIEFSLDNGMTWTSFADSIAAGVLRVNYLWTTPNINSSECKLRVTDINDPNYTSTTSFSITGATGVNEETIPTTFRISVHPNPFNPATTISFSLPSRGQANVTIFDTTGRKVRGLVSGVFTAGMHSAIWNGHDDNDRQVSSGIYIARLTAGKHAASSKMLLMR